MAILMRGGPIRRAGAAISTSSCQRGKLSRGHHAAMPYPEIPAFIARLREKEAMAALANGIYHPDGRAIR